MIESVESVDSLLDGRAGCRVRAGWGSVAVLLGGGHICQIALNTHPDINPLWRPPWRTMDPGQYEPERDAARFGPPPDGRLLAGIAGHSLSFDHFGPPSPDETRAGLSTHGEAPVAAWQLRRQFEGDRPGIISGAVLPVSQIDFERTLRVDAQHPVVYCEERAQNLSAADRPISWNEHVTVGPPFLACDSTFVDMPATDAKVIEASYSDAMGIVPEAAFAWPHAPTPDGGTHNLRTTPEGRYCRYTAQLLDPTLQLGFIAVSSLATGLLLLYVFPRAEFPWVGNWQESFYHTNPPWGGNTFCRGIEFSTTPFAQPKRRTIDEGPLFHEPTWMWLPARSERSVRFVILMLEIPTDYAGVDRVTLENGTLRIAEHSIAARKTGRVLLQPIDPSFLNSGGR